MEFDSVVKKRKSVRSFLAKKPSWKTVLEAIDAANQSPFAGNMNNLKFLIIEEKETIKKLAKFAEQHWIPQAGIVVLVCSDETPLENKYGERGRVYSRQQAGSAIQAFLLKLTDISLSACWVGAYADELVKESLKIPQHIQIEAIIPIGYENKKSSEAKLEKKELENVIYWGHWNNDMRPSLFKEPDDELSLEK